MSVLARELDSYQRAVDAYQRQQGGLITGANDQLFKMPAGVQFPG